MLAVGYILGILGALALIVGALTIFGAISHEAKLRGLMFWLMAAVFFAGEAIVYAINRLRQEIEDRRFPRRR